MSSKSKLIINCGATHVSASEFGVSAGRLVLESFQVQELKYDYSNPVSYTHLTLPTT